MLGCVINRVLDLAQDAYGERFCDVSIDLSAAARWRCEAAGVLGLAEAEAVFIHPVLRSSPRALAYVLAHELAHIVQFRRCYHSEDNFNNVPALEREAHVAAMAALLGRKIQIRSHSAMPNQCAIWPYVALAAAAGAIGLSLWGTAEENEAADEDHRRQRSRGGRLTEEERRRALAHAERLNYETWVGFVPVVGSFDQMVNGRNWQLQTGGAIFFILDISMVGAIATAGVRLAGRAAASGSSRAVSSRSGEIVATITRLDGTSQRALREVARGSGSVQQRAAFEEVLGAIARDELVIVGENAASSTLRNMGEQGTYLIVGAEGVTNHSVAYLVHGQRVFKLHGGTARFAANVSETSRAALSETVASASNPRFGLNTATIYGAEQLSNVSESAVMAIVNRWKARGTGLAGVANRLWAPGCSASQAQLLREFGVFETRFGQSLLPVVLERSRRAGQGAHFILRPGRQAFGNGVVSALPLAGWIGSRETNALATVHAQSLASGGELRLQRDEMVGVSRCCSVGAVAPSGNDRSSVTCPLTDTRTLTARHHSAGSPLRARPQGRADRRLT